MPPDAQKLLHDMLEAARSIADYTRSRSLDDYRADKSLRDSVQWNFIVIGEALAKLRISHPDWAARLTEHTRIIAFRNQLIHGYGVINHEITWSIIQVKLPILRSELGELLPTP